MIKTFLLSLLLVQSILFFLSIELKAQVFKWAKSINCELEEVNNSGISKDKTRNCVKGTGISTDTNGNSFITGSFTGIAGFGKFDLSSVGTDIFIAKYESDGNCLWAKQAGGNFDDCGFGISVSIKGNVFVVGCFQEAAAFGSIHLTSVNSDMFIAKYDPFGNCLWAEQAGGAGNGRSYGISVDSNENVYVTGSFLGTGVFGKTKYNSIGNEDIFVAKYDKNGNCLWAKQAGGKSFDGGTGISVDTRGNSYITGYFLGDVAFGEINLTSFGTNDIFIAKYDTSGNCVWVKNAGGTHNDEGKGISVDQNGNIYITGHFNGPATFGTVHLNGFGGFIASYDSIGNCLWAKLAGNRSSQGISIDPNRNSYVTGNFYGTATIGTIQLTSNGYDDIFIAKYDHNGNILLALNAGGANFDYGYGISVDSYGNSYVIGDYTGDAMFGEDELSSVGAFIAKVSGQPRN